MMQLHINVRYCYSAWRATERISEWLFGHHCYV